MHYELLLPRRILFGWGRRSELPRAAAVIGRRALLVPGSRTLEANGSIAALVDSLQEEGIAVEQIATQSREPEVADVDRTANLVRKLPLRDGDFLLAVGGGSAIDLAKAVAAMAVNRAGESVRDYLEGVGRGLTLTEPPLPIVAVPTTAGTGSEATKNAVISSCDPPFKKSLRSDALLPRLVVVDPELTVSTPRSVTAQSGMDALTQLIESFISRRAKPVPQALCRQGIPLALNSLVEAVEQPASRTARENMAHAALLSGIALANSGLGMAHGVAAALGVHCRVPHGLACAVMLPAALETNRRVSLPLIAEISKTAFQGRHAAHGSRIRENSAVRFPHSRILTNSATTPATASEGRPTSELDDEQAAELAVETIRDISRRIGIPERLSEIGVTAEHIPDLVRSSRGNSMSGNPREISDGELAAILEGLL